MAARCCWGQTKEEYEADYLFAEDEDIRLKFPTVREIVRLMVEMAEPKFGDIICDPASGSGGFLIRFFAKVREQLLAEADAACAKFKAELEKKKLASTKRAELLRKEYERLQRDLDPKNTQSRLWELSNRCIYGVDANDRMARTSKMNMIMRLAT